MRRSFSVIASPGVMSPLLELVSGIGGGYWRTRPTETLVIISQKERRAIGIPGSRFWIRWAESEHFGHPPCSGFFPPLPEREGLFDLAVDPATHSFDLYPPLGGEPDLGSSAAVHPADRAAGDRVGPARQPITTVGSASDRRTRASHRGTIAWGRMNHMAFHGVAVESPTIAHVLIFAPKGQS
jgi:hypothetical protein